MSASLLSIDAADQGAAHLCAALSLSLVTRRGFEWRSARALTTAELSFVRAAAQVGRAFVEGAAPGTTRLAFVPRSAVPGDHALELDDAASATLATQMLALPLALAQRPSMLVVRGGTHVAGSPSFHELAGVWAPMLARVGIALRLSMPRAGFTGGGEIATFIAPAGELRPVFLPTRGTLLEVQILTMMSGAIEGAAGMGKRAAALLRARGILAEAESVPMQSASPGAALMLLATFEHSRAAFTALAVPGARADKLADEAVLRLATFLERRGAVDPQLADQLLIPLAVAATRHPSRYATSEITEALLARARLVEQFLDVRVQVDGALGSEGAVAVRALP